MKRALAVLGLMAVGTVAWSADLGACGDKSLSAGGIRFQRALAARYPASILIYAQPNSRIEGAVRELRLPQTLEQVGHRYRQVGTWADVEAALDSGRFNIVLTDVSQLAAVQQRLTSSRSRSVVIPVGYRLTKSEEKAIANQSRFVVKAPSRASQYLDTITDAVRSTGNDLR